MNENMCICSYMQKTLFETKELSLDNTNITFVRTNEMPEKSKKYDLIVVVCDFDNDASIEKFYDIADEYNTKHIHIFIVGEQWKVRNLVAQLIKMKKEVSFSIIINDDFCTINKIKGEVLNFISPLCSTMWYSFPNEYGLFSGLVTTDVYEYLSEGEIRTLISKVADDEICIIGMFGSNYSILEIENLKKIIDDKGIKWSSDLSKTYSRFVLIKGKKNLRSSI